LFSAALVLFGILAAPAAFSSFLLPVPPSFHRNGRGLTRFQAPPRVASHFVSPALQFVSYGLSSFQRACRAPLGMVAMITNCLRQLPD